jgi:hypothetical protein
MTLDEIKSATQAGLRVCWKNTSYAVMFDSATNQWLIAFIHRTSYANYTGLTWADGVTMNGKPEDFFIDPRTIPLNAPQPEAST